MQREREAVASEGGEGGSINLAASVRLPKKGREPYLLIRIHVARLSDHCRAAFKVVSGPAENKLPSEGRRSRIPVKAGHLSGAALRHAERCTCSLSNYFFFAAFFAGFLAAAFFAGFFAAIDKFTSFSP